METIAKELDVSVILPVYNERGHLKAEIDRVRSALSASSYSFEIIVIDDGSNDGSELDLPLIPDIRLIRHSVNRGSGAARRTGTRAAYGRVVVWTDVDMTYPNDEIPWLVDQLEGSDHVVGPRRTEEGTLKLLRMPAKWFIRKLASYLTETDIKDPTLVFVRFAAMLLCNTSTIFPMASRVSPHSPCHFWQMAIRSLTCPLTISHVQGTRSFIG